jgi:hypothetical protein
LDAIINYKHNQKPQNKEAASPCWSPTVTLRGRRLEIFCLLLMAMNSREVPVNGKKWVTLYFARMSEHGTRGYRGLTVTVRYTMLLFQCHALAEEVEQDLDEWWFNKQGEDLHKHLCIDTLKSCCPDNHYGADCKPCPGFPGNVCNKSGKCKVGALLVPATELLLVHAVQM